MPPTLDDSRSKRPTPFDGRQASDGGDGEASHQIVHRIEEAGRRLLLPHRVEIDNRAARQATGAEHR